MTTIASERRTMTGISTIIIKDSETNQRNIKHKSVHNCHNHPHKHIKEAPQLLKQTNQKSTPDVICGRGLIMERRKITIILINKLKTHHNSICRGVDDGRQGRHNLRAHTHTHKLTRTYVRGGWKGGQPQSSYKHTRTHTHIYIHRHIHTHARTHTNQSLC